MSRANISCMKMRTLTRILTIASLLLCGLSLTACGSKGDLYLSENPAAPQRTAQ